MKTKKKKKILILSFMLNEFVVTNLFSYFIIKKKKCLPWSIFNFSHIYKTCYRNWNNNLNFCTWILNPLDYNNKSVKKTLNVMPTPSL